MFKKISLFILIAMLSAPFLHAQVTHLCDHYNQTQKEIANDPDYSRRIAELEAFTKEYLAMKEPAASEYTVPVVVHVMHTWGDENISREQVIEAINQLNLDFNKANSDTNLIIAPFKPIAGNASIAFRLAKLDPDGNCTDGIVRVYTPMTHAADDAIKELSRWPRNKYLNIWVVSTIASGAAGYSYYPGVNSENDGVVLRSDYMGSTGTSSLTRAHTLSHEVGHWLNLAHPWGNSNEPGLSTNCDIDDGVEDTPNTIGHTSCDLWGESCGSLDNVQNFMEYSYCTRMFTAGQGARMQAAINSNSSSRKSLWQDSNLWATGTHPFYQALDCAPIAEFTANTQFTCQDGPVQFFDQSSNSEVGQWHWYFPGGNPSESNQKNPVVSYAVAGVYPVYLKSYSQSGSDSIAKESFITIQNNDSTVVLPFAEGFENPAFPATSNYPLSSWHTEDGVGYPWAYTTVASSSGSSCIFINNKENTPGEIHTLISPIINIPPLSSSIKLSFKYAYVQTDSNSSDELIVSISKDCGLTWQMRYTNEGYFLSSTGVAEPGIFVPTSTQWKTIERDLDVSLSGANSFTIKFQFTNGSGNNLYLDDIGVSAIISSAEYDMTGMGISIFPNPIARTSDIHLQSKESTHAILQLIRMDGLELYKQSIELEKGDNSFALSQVRNLAAGMYLVRLETAGGVAVQRLLIQ